MGIAEGIQPALQSWKVTGRLWEYDTPAVWQGSEIDHKGSLAGCPMPLQIRG